MLAFHWLNPIRPLLLIKILRSDIYPDIGGFIVETIASGCRTQGQKERQVTNLDASPRQLINGVVNHLGSKAPEKVVVAYKKYVSKLQELQLKIQNLVLELDILPNYRIFSDIEADVESQQIKTNRKKSSLLSREEMVALANERLEVAAHIIDRLEGDKNLGRTKLAKVFYLVDVSNTTDLKATYKREAAGPLDVNIVYGDSFGYEKLGSNNKLFQTLTTKKMTKYIPGKELRSFVKGATGKWKKDLKETNRIIDLFAPLNTKRTEIIATVYACWNDLLIEKKKPTNDKILDEFFNHWHDKKKDFDTSEVEPEIQWLKENKLVPKGKKGYTKRK